MRRLCDRLIAASAALIALAAVDLFAHPAIDARIRSVSARIEATPTDADLYLRRGDLYRQLGDWSAALDDFENAERRGADPVELMYQKGRLWADAGDAVRARSYLDRVVALRPDDPHARLARARLASVSPQSATNDLTRAIDVLERPAPDLYVERARILLQAGAAFHEMAAQGIEEGIERLGPLVTLLDTAVEIELSRQRFDAALNYLRRLPSVLQSQPEWLLRYADALSLAGRQEEANFYYDRTRMAVDARPAAWRRSERAAAIMRRLDEVQSGG